jgi:hypothetical protein
MLTKYFAITVCLLFYFNLYAGTTGKIAGHVTDDKTGEPLPGVNIVIEDQNLGAATDLDGFYYIINVPPGKQKITVSYIGYKTLTYENLEVEINRTVTVNFRMEQDILESGDIIVVMAERELIKKDLTMSSQHIESDEIMALPVESFESVALLQAGAVDGHFRGGRSNEVVPIIDGMIVKDPTTGYDVVSIWRDDDFLETNVYLPESAIEQIEVITGGFNAEYGNAQSAIINVVTREGGMRQSGRLVIKTSGLNYDTKRYWFKNENGNYVYLRDKGLKDFFDQTQPHDSLIALGVRGPSMKNNAYLNNSENFLIDDYQRKEYEFSLAGPLPFTKSRLRYSIHGEIIDNDQHQLSYWLPQFQGAFQSKFVYHFSTKYKLQLTGVGSMTNNRSVGHFEAKFPGGYYPGIGLLPPKVDSEEWEFSRNLSTSLKWTHLVSNKTFYEIQLGFNYNSFERKLKDWNDRDGDGNFDEFLEWRKLNAPDDPTDSLTTWSEQWNYGTDAMQYVWVEANPDAKWSGGWKWAVPGTSDWREIWYLNTSDLCYDKEWRYLTGEVNEEDLTSYPIHLRTESDLYLVPDSYFDYYGDGGHYWDTENYTYHLKADITSQITTQHLLKGGIALALTHSDIFRIQSGHSQGGLLMDIYNVKPFDLSAYIQDKMEFAGMILNAGVRVDYFSQGENIQFPADIYDPIDHTKMPSDSGYVKNPVTAEPFFEFSPRLGISHPISENAALHFSYGHFYQRPEYRYWYNNRSFDMEYGPSPGNPFLRPEKTVAYEIGYQQRISEYVIKVNLFYKDVFDLTGRQEAGNPELGFFLSTLSNRAWADHRGVEISVRKHFSHFFAGNINYTYMIAKGQSSDPWSTGEEGARRPIYLDWDRRHTLYANLTLGTPLQWGPQIAGFFPLDNWNLTFLYIYKSPLPYTPDTHDYNEDENSLRLDESVSRTDIKLTKRFNLGKHLTAILLLEGYNIFNQINPVGLPENIEWYEQNGSYEGRNFYPSVWEARRHFRFGFGFEF